MKHITSIVSASAAILLVGPNLFAQVDQTKAPGNGETQTPAAPSAWQSDRSALSSSSTNATSSNVTSTNSMSTDAASSGSESFQASSSAASSVSVVRLASEQEARRTASRLVGRKVQSANGAEVGTVKDFLVDPQSGTVRFAVISTGGFIGIGDRLHLVRFEGLQPGSGNTFRLAMTTDELARSQLINEEQFEENRIAATTGNLVRATKLKGREVSGKAGKIGRIEGVVIEPGSSTAMALLATDQSMGANASRFLVPLDRLSLNSTGRELQTTLTRADFESATQAGRTASMDTPTGNPNATSTQLSENATADASSGTAAPDALGAENTSASQAPSNAAALSPTGRSSAEQNPTADPQLVAAAHAVRQALDSDPTTAHADVQIVPANGRLQLEGNVASESQKSAVENKARQASNGCPIDSHLKLR